MSPTTEDRVKKAEETWRHFQEVIPDELLRAVSGAFALIACADGELDESEIDVFLEMVKDTRAFAQVNLEALSREFRELAVAMLSDYEHGRRRALNAIAQVRGDDQKTALVVSAAQIAVIADTKLHEVEEMVLEQVCEALGLDPGSY